MSEQQIMLAVVVLIFGLGFTLEVLSGKLKGAGRPWRDGGFTLAGILSHGLLAGPIAAGLAGYWAVQLFPDHAGGLSGINFWLAFSVIFVSQEFAHYWLHRLTHEKEWLWKIHRTHHTAENLNMGVLYRYNIFWTMMLPQVWVGPFAIYLGLGMPYVLAVMVTFFVNAATHTAFRWDLWLREKMPWSEPFWRVLEKVVTLPDTHHAHHAWGPGSHLNGNYAVTLFIFDTLYGTAKIPNRRQKRFGLPKARSFHWSEELFWPIVRKSDSSDRKHKKSSDRPKTAKASA